MNLGTVLIFDMVAGKHMQTLKINPAHVTTFEFHPSERILGAATSSRAIRLWDLDSMQLLAQTAPEIAPIKSLAFGCDVNEGGVVKPTLCISTKDHVKLWAWGPPTDDNDTYSSNNTTTMSIKGQLALGSEGAPLSALAVDSTSGCITGGSCISNFMSVYSTTTEHLVENYQEQQHQQQVQNAARQSRLEQGGVPSIGSNTDNSSSGSRLLYT